MVATYTLFGRQIGSHVLAMSVLGTAFLGGFYATSGSSKKPAQQTPPINASSKDEENFIQEFLKNAEVEDKQKH